MSELVDRLREIVGAANGVTGDAAVDFTHDATFLEHDLLAVVRPAQTEEVAAVVRACAETRTPIVARGSGTSLVGGLTVVLADGQVLKLGGRLRKRSSGYRLIQLFVGSEGTLGIVTEVILKLLPLPRHRATALVGFRSVEDAGQAVARVLGAGHFPACVELLDRDTMQLVHEWLPPGLEPDPDAPLIIEQDGNDSEQVQLTLLQMVELLDGVDNRIAQSSVERERLWQAP